jgi:tetratricopeptide (TPR) repeat protein
MRTRSLALTGALILLLAAVPGLFLQVQPADRGRILRRSDRLTLLPRRLGLALRFGGDGCLVPLAAGRPFLRQTVPVTTSDGSSLDATVSFTYDLPAQSPEGWPGGDWCSALADRASQAVRAAVVRLPFDEVLENPRRAADRAAVALSSSLAGLKPGSLALRLELPRGAESLRTVPAVREAAQPRKPVIFIGLDGADWQLLDLYMQKGAMPNLAAFVREGHGGSLTTEMPPLSPIIWTTMMTGVSPLEHQILDFTRYNPASGNKEPITSYERKRPAIWNMETYAGRTSAVFGLWATYPAEPVRGTLVSDRLFTFLFNESTPPPGVVYPSSREAAAREQLKAAESDVTLDTLRQYLPWLQQAQYDDLLKVTDPYARPDSALRRILVETRVYERLSLDALKTQLPDLSVIYFQGTDSIGHVFAPYAPPRQSSVSQEDYDRYAQVPEKYFRHVDELLGEYRRLAQQAQATVVIASDHGFLWSEGRPQKASSVNASTAAKWHRKEGIYVIWGPGIAAVPGHPEKGEVRQICPTLLASSGLPIGVGMPPPLPGALPPPQPPLSYTGFFSPLEPAATSAATGDAANEEIAKLKALGYIASNDSGRAGQGAKGATKTADAWNNEGVYRQSQHDVTGAIAAFEKAIEINPDLSSALWNLSDVLFDKKHDLDRSDAMMARAVGAGFPDSVKAAIERAIGYQRAGMGKRSLALLEAAVQAKPDDGELHMFRGRYRIEQKDCAGALEDFQAATRIRPDDPVSYASVGLASLCLGDPQGAAAAFRRSLELNPDQPRLRAYLQQAQ